jgi:hypothetical protein
VQERTAEELAEDETIDCNIVEFLKEKVGHSSPLKKPSGQIGSA